MLSRLLSLLIPADERALVLRELDDLRGRRAERKGTGRAGLWYLGQLASFGLRLRAERARTAMVGGGGLLADIGFSLRTLLRRPGYLAAGILTLGIGTGGVATIYTAADWVLLRDVPGVGDPDELVWIRLESNNAESWGTQSWGIMQPDLEIIRERTETLVAFEGAAEHEVHVGLGADATPTRESAALVTPGYFEMLRMTPAVGRFFSPEEHRGGAAPPEVVIGQELWRRGWSRSSAAIGDEIEINGRPFTVIGVAPRGFRGAELPGRNALWLASSAFAVVRPDEAGAGLDGAIQLWDPLIGRRAPGASVSDVLRQANEAIEWIRTERSGQQHSFLAGHFTFRVYPGIGLDPGIRAETRRTLLIVLGGSLFLLALTIANVANLGLTRAASRRGMYAIRRALGAGTWRVSREPLIEGAILGIGGGALALALMGLGTGALEGVTLVAGDASLEGMALSAGPVAVTLVLALLGGLVSGVVPAMAVRRERALDWLQGGRRSDPSLVRTRTLLVVGQVAVSVALLVGAGLLVQTVRNLNAIDLGLSRDAYLFSIDPGLNDYDEARTREVVSRVRDGLWERFGAESSGLTWPTVMHGWRITGTVRAVGAPEDEYTFGSTQWTSGRGFFRGVGLEFVAGEGFVQPLLVADSLYRPVVLNESMARGVFPDRPLPAVVGQPVIVGQDAFESTVVGVVTDTRLAGPLQDPSPIVFRPWDLGWSAGSATFAVRSGRPASETRAAVLDIVRSADSAVPIYDEGTLGGRADTLLSSTRVVSGLAAALGVIGLILVALGLYGVLAYAVTERTREIGVRVALGASTARVRREILGRGVRLALGGMLLAIPLVLWTTRSVESVLYDLSPADPLTYLAGLAVILTVTVAASWIPARRATAISPVTALKEE